MRSSRSRASFAADDSGAASTSARNSSTASAERPSSWRMEPDLEPGIRDLRALGMVIDQRPELLESGLEPPQRVETISLPEPRVVPVTAFGVIGEELRVGVRTLLEPALHEEIEGELVAFLFLDRIVRRRTRGGRLRVTGGGVVRSRGGGPPPDSPSPGFSSGLAAAVSGAGVRRRNGGGLPRVRRNSGSLRSRPRKALGETVELGIQVLLPGLKRLDRARLDLRVIAELLNLLGELVDPGRELEERAGSETAFELLDAGLKLARRGFGGDRGLIAGRGGLSARGGREGEQKRERDREPGPGSDPRSRGGTAGHRHPGSSPPRPRSPESRGRHQRVT